MKRIICLVFGHKRGKPSVRGVKCKRCGTPLYLNRKEIEEWEKHINPNRFYPKR